MRVGVTVLSRWLWTRKRERKIKALCRAWDGVGLNLTNSKVRGEELWLIGTGALGFGAGSCLALSVQFDEIWWGTDGLQVRKLPN